MNAKWKAFKEGGLNALFSSLIQIKGAADDNASAVSGLGQDFAEMAELTAQELAGKQDKFSAVAVTLPASGWASDGTVGYPYYCDLPVEGITAKDRVEVTISPAGLGTAFSCGLCPTNETLEGKIRIRAAGVPEKDIPAEYWVEQGGNPPNKVPEEGKE